MYFIIYKSNEIYHYLYKLYQYIVEKGLTQRYVDIYANRRELVSCINSFEKFTCETQL